MDYSGPLWLGKIFDKQFCELMAKENTHVALKNSGKIAKLLTLAKDEAEASATYYVLDKITNKIALPVPSLQAVLMNLCEKGFQAFPTHFSTRGVRTDAPALTMQDLLRKMVATA
jgi:tRNA (guanine26-N2/guanine27-N2)-dimethyltransferase